MNIAHISLAIVAVTPRTSHSQTLAVKVDSVLTSAAANGFSGVIRLQRNGETVIEKGYGLADRAKGIPFRPNTVVQIGSNTKDFTAVAILQLHERGQLSLSDPISRFIPDAPADKASITIDQLLDHEAGFPLGLGPDTEQRTRTALLDSAMKFRLLFSPGSRKSYSNTGYSLLAAIIEIVTEKSYDEYVRDNILEPLGLRDTGYHLPGFASERLARGYASGGRDAGNLLERPRLPDGPYWNLRGNGGMLSTLADMHEFYKALFETDRLLKPETRNLRFDPRAPIALAGSDLVNFFLYERDPARATELFIASTSQDYKAGRVVEELRKLPELGGGSRRVVHTTGPEGVARREGPAPAPAVASVVKGFVDAVNAGDREVLRRFIAANFATGDGMPTVDERLGRIDGMHENLGHIEIVRMTASPEGPVEAVVRTEKEGGAMLLVDVERSAPHKIRRIGIQVGD